MNSAITPKIYPDVGNPSDTILNSLPTANVNINNIFNFVAFSHHTVFKIPKNHTNASPQIQTHNGFQHIG